MSTTKSIASIFAVASLTFLAPAARAQAPAAQPLAMPPAASAPHISDSYFQKGSYTLDLYGGYALGFTGHRENIFNTTAGFNYYVVDNISLGVKVSGYAFDQPGRTAVGTGASVLLRHNLLRHDPWTFFVDVGGGVFMGDRQIPAGGTHLNFTQETGLGFTYRLHDNVYLIAGPRYFHLSNAHIKGPNRNPSINGVEVYVGLSFGF